MNKVDFSGCFIQAMVTISNKYLYNILTQYTLISICLKDVCKVGMVVNTDNPITQKTMSEGS